METRNIRDGSGKGVSVSKLQEVNITNLINYVIIRHLFVQYPKNTLCVLKNN